MAPSPTRSRCPERLRNRARAGLLVAIVAAGSAVAGVRLDDSPSPKSRVEVNSRWEHRDGGNGSGEEYTAVIASVANQEIRLNTAAYVGKTAEIYLVMPVDIQGLRSASALRAEWRTRGRFLAGSALPGQRTLVFRGPISDRLTGDYFDFTYRIDARYFDAKLQLSPHFEIDVLH